MGLFSWYLCIDNCVLAFVYLYLHLYLCISICITVLQGGDLVPPLDWRGGVRPSGQEDVVEFVEYLEEDEMVEEEEEVEEVEDLVSPLVDKKGDSTAPVSLKKTRKRSQVCLVSSECCQLYKSSIYQLLTQTSY